MGIKLKQEIKIENLSSIQYEVLVGLLLAEARAFETTVEHSLPQADESDAVEGFDEAAAEVLQQLEERARSLVTFLADLRSRLQNRPKPIHVDFNDEDEEEAPAGGSK